MKTLLKIFAAAAALAMVPAAAPAQQTAPATTQAAPPSDAISANSQAAPAQPEQISAPQMGGDEAPAAIQVAAAAPMASQATPTPGIGQPDGRMGFQDQVTPIGHEALWFHDWILMPLIIAISLFVLILLLFVIVRFRRSANPVPSRTSHNTTIEILWTLIPVLILVAIAVPSIRLLSHQYNPPKADLTVKATGNQWYWTYTYPDNGDFEIISNVLSDADAKKRGEPRLLAVDERMVVPVNAVVKVITTSTDVIHSWGVPAFWAKIDAVPGRLNETWFKAERPGLYYGQCFELCGARHGYMPIAVEVVSQAQFAAWVAAKGGKMPGGAKPSSPDATANSPISNPQPAAASGGSEATPEPTNISAGTATPPVTNQSQATSSRGN
jgi:cytochrome c oxidase subunit 2